MADVHLVARFDSAEHFLATFEREVKKRGLLIPATPETPPTLMAPCTVELAVEGCAPVSVPARVAALVPGIGVAVIFDAVPEPLAALAASLASGTAAPEAVAPEEASDADEKPAGLVSEQLRAMSVAEKISFALSAPREFRMALMRDSNKTIHVYLLKNPRIGLDEVQYAAKNPNFSPEALKLIAEHREWGNNATILAALVRNPKLPLPLAQRLVDKLPLSDARNLAKGGAREAIVHAARRRVL